MMYPFKLDEIMIEILLETQLVISVITVLVFYLLINQIIKNISSTNDKGVVLLI